MGYTDEIMKYEVLSTDEEQELAKRMADGDKEARDRLVCCNLRLVAKIAQDYKGMGVDLEELVGAGNMGLIEAADKFKSGKNSRFGTFAQFHIRHSMMDALSRMSGAMSKSIGTYNRHKKIRNAKEELGEGASVEDVARKCGSRSRKTVSDALAGNFKVSLSDKVNEGSDRTYLDVIEDEYEQDSLSQLAHEERMDAMFAGLDGLDSTERFVVESLFGLCGAEPKVLREVGQALHVTAERVRQIKDNALKKLRVAIEEGC